jgi:hypothetical protein
VEIDKHKFHSEKIDDYLTCAQAYEKHRREMTPEVIDKIKADLEKSDEQARRG